MRIVHVIDSIRKRASGPSYSVTRLCRALSEQGHDVALHVLEPASLPSDPNFEIVVHPSDTFPPRIGASRAARRAIESAISRADVVHTNGLWRMPQIYASRAAARHNVALVVSPRGALSPWARSWHAWRKRALWATMQRRAIHRAGCVHTTGDGETADVRRSGFSMPAAQIPNGVDIPFAATDERSPQDIRRVLFLGRIHPIKNVGRLIDAWRSIQDDFPAAELQIVGPDELGHTDELRLQSRSIGAVRIVFRGAVLGSEKDDVLHSADVLVLPSHSENFGVVVAEALSRGIPCIASRGAPWAGLETHQCGWWVDPTTEGLSSALQRALSMPADELRASGLRGRTWMQQDFGWNRIAEQMAATYTWLIRGGDCPPWVQTIDSCGRTSRTK